MTIKEAMTRALDNAADFPLGWNTELSEVFRKSDKELYERKQKTVWVLRIVPPTATSRRRSLFAEAAQRRSS